MRNAAIAALAVPDLYLSGPWHPWPADGIAVDFDEAQTLYARTDRAGGCSIRRVTDDAEIYRLPPLGWPAYPSLSQDGKFIVLTQFNRSVSISTAIHVWQLEGAAPRKSCRSRKHNGRSFKVRDKSLSGTRTARSGSSSCRPLVKSADWRPIRLRRES